MRQGLLGLCLLPLLAACGDREEPLTPGPARDEQAAASEPAAAAPLDESPSFVGVWAATPEMCRDGAWMFTPQGVRTAGEVSCTWSKVERTESGYTLSGSCTAQAPAAPAEVMLLMDPTRPGAMTVSGGPWGAAVTLQRCADGTAAPAAPAAPPAAAEG